MFSADEGRTWSESNRRVDGPSVVGLPSRPSPPGSPYDPVAPYLYLAPSGELVATAMSVDLSGLQASRHCHADGCAWITVSGDAWRTWDAWRKVTFTNVPEGESPDDIGLTQDSFVDGADIHAASRIRDKERLERFYSKAIAGLFKSADNGRTWGLVNHIDPDVNWDRTLPCATGIKRVGPTEIVAVTRGTLLGSALPWVTRSRDMGRMWTPLVQGGEKVGSRKRPRIYTNKHLVHLSGAENIHEWWYNDLPPGTGLEQVSADPFLRNVGLWYSMDKGGAWSAPLHLHEDTEGAGYGDLRARKDCDLLVVSYHGSFA